MLKVYENQNMVVEVDEIDTVSVLNKATESKATMQVDNDSGFKVVYSEGDQDLTTAIIGTGGSFEIICEVTEGEEEIEEVYNEFMARIEKVNKGNDDFFRKSFDTNVGSFDMKRPQSSPEDIAKKRNMFFAKVQKVEPVKTASGTAQNITVRTPSAKDNY